MSRYRLSERRHVHELAGTLLISGVTLGILQVAVNDSRWNLVIWSVIALTVNLVAYLAVQILSPDTVMLRIAIVPWVIQCLALATIGATGAPTQIGLLLGPSEDLTDYPKTVAGGLILVPLAAVSIAGLRSLFFVSRQRRWSVASLAGFNPRCVLSYSYIFAVLQVLYWPAAQEYSGIPGYFVRSMIATFAWFPFISGLYYQQTKFAHRIWVAALVLNMAVGLALGSRERALVPAMLYTLGLVLASRGQTRKRAIRLAAAGAVPFFFVASVVGDVRGALGRGGLEILTLDRVSAMSSAIGEAMTGQSSETSVGLVQSQGVARVFVWPNAMASIMTPDMIPFRSFGGLLDEVRSYAGLSLFTGRDQESYYELGLGTAPAGAYGFIINTETSVDFGILGDLWSRGGPIAVYVGAAGFLIFVMVFEALQKQIAARNPAASLLLFCLLAKSVFGGAVVPTLISLRQILIGAGLCYLLSFIGSPLGLQRMVESSLPRIGGPVDERRS